MTPIPITFTRQPPDCSGWFLWQRKPGFPMCVEFVDRSSRGEYHVGMRYVEDIGGEWAGPLIVNENEAGEHQEGKEGT